MSNDPVHTETLSNDFGDSVTIKIYYDTDPMSPRDWDNLGKFYAFNSSDASDIADSNDLPTSRNGGWYGSSYKSVAASKPLEFAMRCLIAVEGVTVIPCQYYYHGGSSLSFGTANEYRRIDEWANCLYVADANKTAENLKLSTPTGGEPTWSAAACLEAELTEFNSYLEGYVYGYVIESASGADIGEHIDSCWGFIGEQDYCLSEATSAAQNALDHRTHLRKLRGRALRRATIATVTATPTATHTEV